MEPLCSLEDNQRTSSSPGRRRESKHGGEDQHDHTEGTFDDSEDVDDAESLASTQSEPEQKGTFEITVTQTIVQRAGGVALYSVLALSFLISLVSFLLIYQINETAGEGDFSSDAIDNSMPSYPSEGICHRDVEGLAPPLWQYLLTTQIDVIQNLIHAALLGATAMVLAVRGDAVWLFFVRNVAFFFLPISICYMLSDVYNAITQDERAEQYMIRLVIIYCFVATSAVAFFKHERTCRMIRRLFVSQEKLQPITDTLGVPVKDVPLMPAEMSKANIIHYGAVMTQVLSLLYMTVTTTQWFLLQSECPTDPDSGRMDGVMQGSGTRGNLRPFVMAYSHLSHQGFLLALFMLAATFPRDRASLGGAIMSSGWRLLVACGSLVSICSDWDGTVRDSFSLLYTSLEAATMVPIIIAAVSLMRSSLLQENGQALKGYGEVEQDEEIADENSVEEIQACDEIGDEAFGLEKVSCGRATTSEIQRFQCPTLSQIAASGSYSKRQRWGARMLSLGSVGLLVGMTLECIVLLRQNFVGTHATHDIYKWGMHICVIYFVCSMMAAETPWIYKRARVILAVACPVGSLVAIWQLVTLITESPMDDVWTVTVAGLFAWRAACGFMQLIGLVILNNTEPCNRILVRETNRPGFELQAARAAAQFALYKLYFPCLVLYIVCHTLTGSCFAPMLSMTIPSESCAVADMDLMLAQHWPGLDLFFHFSMVGLLFASDGLRAELPSYRPALPIAALCYGHLAILIFTHFIWDAAQTEGWTSLSAVDFVRRILLFLWMITSGYLALCLHRLWKLRLLPL